MARTAFRLFKELVIAAVLLGFGLYALPVIVYRVGARIVGDYGADGGVNALIANVREDLLAGNVFAWLLVTSPYFIVQLLRVGRLVWRAKPGVTSVTVSDINQ